MNKLVDQYFEALQGKRIIVLGIGVSNRPLIRMLLERRLYVIACDKTEREVVDAEVLELEQAGAELRLGSSYLENLRGDIVFRTPGMHPDIPALRQLRESGASVTSEMEAFFAVCPCQIIAVTGSDGKTTTTTLIAEILKQAGKRVWVGGNIGQPLLPLADQMEKDDIAVVELSSFQLMHMKQSPHIAVVTNLAPNHLDVHKDMDEYVEAKMNIFLHQKAGDKLILNIDNEITASFTDKAVDKLCGFSVKSPLARGVCFHDDTIWHNGKAVMQRKDIAIPGMHNVENYMAAIAATEDYADDADVLYVARNFKGVEHRIELVRELNGVRYYNDSIASSPSRTIAGLHAFEEKVILIAGGYDKQIPFDVLGPEVVAHVKALILCGHTAEKIKDSVINAAGYDYEELPIIVETSLKNAVLSARDLAVQGDVVTLSPACAAFDQFKNFMERGKTFKQIVMEL